MATRLDKDIIRETSIKFDDREVQITLTSDQKIFMKLKGMKSGSVEISIEELYKQLKGITEESNSKNKTGSLSILTDNDNKKGDNPMMSLYDIRHRFNVSEFDYPTTCKLDSILVELISEKKKKIIA